YMWPASVLNALRRDAVEALENLLITDHETAWAELAVELQDMSSIVAKGKVQYSEPMVSARVDELEAVKAAIEGG
ncbi:Peptidase U32, partial [human gut metagenome]